MICEICGYDKSETVKLINDGSFIYKQRCKKCGYVDGMIEDYELLKRIKEL